MGGLIVEVVKAVSMGEKERLLVNYVSARLKEIFLEVAENFDDNISKGEFVKLLEHREAEQAFQDIGVDLENVVDLAEDLFEDTEEISFTSFLEKVLTLRGSNTAQVKDIVDMRCTITREIRHLSNRLETFAEKSQNLSTLNAVRGVSTLKGGC